MRSRFKWYLNPSKSELEEAWAKGTLSLDANVLLDLYRYHEKTQENLISAISSFKKRVWLSNQASEEFFRNRKAVIASAEKTFRETEVGLSDLRKSSEAAINSMKANRLIPRDGLDKLSEHFARGMADAASAIEASRLARPDYLSKDKILETLMNIFDGRVGDPPSAERLVELLKEGKRRHERKIPPGYMDDDKDGDRPYGDFLLWTETLEFAASSGKPLILVTSERKEDWWERHVGRRVGPRLELIREAFELSGQRIIIYQTDHFLEVFAGRSGSKISDDAVEEIREVGARQRVKRSQDVAVSVNQIVSVANIYSNTGFLEIDLLRPVAQFTGSGRLEPRMDSIAEVKVSLLSAPDGAPAVNIHAATGTDFDFNVHIRSAEKGALLPIGKYEIRYAATGLKNIMRDLDIHVSNLIVPQNGGE